MKSPHITCWDAIDDIRYLDELPSVDTAQVDAFCRNTDAFVLSGSFPRPFEQLQWLRGTERLFMDLLTDPEFVSELLKQVHEFYLKEFETWCATSVDAVWFMDDWGSQNALLISPGLWREFFLPCYRDYISMAHKYGKKVFFHSDGNMLAILLDLIEAGLDAVNTQIFCMDWNQLQKICRGNITLWGEIDRQNLLPYATQAEITEAVTSVYEKFYADGYLIAHMEFGPGARPENIITAFETWDRVHKRPQGT